MKIPQDSDLWLNIQMLGERLKYVLVTLLNVVSRLGCVPFKNGQGHVGKPIGITDWQVKGRCCVQMDQQICG